MTIWTQAIFCAVAAGLLWCALGVLYSRAARRGTEFAGMMTVGMLFLSAAAWWLWADWAEWRAAPLVARGQFLTLFGVAGLLLVWAGLCLQLAMRRGHHGRSWAVGQSALILPVLAGVVIWKETLTLGQLLGLSGVVLSLLLLARSRGDGSNPAHRPSWWAFGAFLGWGLQQSLLSSQAYVPSLTALQSWRIPVSTTATLVGWALWLLLQRRRPSGAAWRSGLICAAVLLPGYWFMFRGLDLLQQVGATSLFFPMAVGTNVLAFALYSSRRERWTLRSGCGLLLGVAGLVLIGLASRQL